MGFDYVIVGGGSAGSVLAARLSEDPAVSVCLIEAGGRANSIFHRAPTGAVALVPGWGRIGNWMFRTTKQQGLGGRRGFQPRGMGLGGSSAINAMLYVRGHASDYDDWAAQGCDGWDWNSVLPYFLRAENNERGPSALHGADGPLQVSNQRALRPVSAAFVAAARALGHPARDDFNTGETHGAGFYQVTQFHRPDKRGERCSAAQGYLAPVRARPNLKVITRARASRILFDGLRATGVEYRRKGATEQALATREVILAAGALQSPQLLLLSGIGPAAALAPHGIAQRHELPGVGENLHDHADFVLAFRSRDRDNFGLGLRPTLKLLGEALKWRRDGSSMVASPFAEGAAFLKSDPNLPRPDLQLHFVIAIVDRHARRLHWGNGWSCHVCALYPKSRGRVTLASADPMADPVIDPAFFSHPDDLAATVTGAKITRAILTAPQMAPYRAREMFGTDQAETDADWVHHIKARADTIYHPVGTCRMGVDEMAVTDPRLRVRGLTGLRVVDASVMPRLTGGNTNAPTIMIAEKAADMIREDARQGEDP